MIDAAKDGFIGRITLNNPAKHNALDSAAMRRIIEVLDGWRDTDIRAVILTGTGKSFCAGVSLTEVGRGIRSDLVLETLCNAVENFPAPVIAALNGGVFGGGVDLALSCDFRIGVTGMKMFVPPAALGIHYQPSGIARAVQRLGAQMARRVFLLAERFENQALFDSGFLDFQVQADQLQNVARTKAQEIAGLAPMAVQGMKKSILAISRNDADTDAALRIDVCFASHDHVEGLAAKREKRQPVFTGT
ncbi:MAG: enoyl-CoA hydratase/isomerase family protein [Rhodobacteraceae bacterium]|nr:enoyl-CoA hydratase/isomerase family protein [Paracoccaceae bacterium]